MWHTFKWTLFCNKTILLSTVLLRKMQRMQLAWAFAGRLCDKHHNLMSWLICLMLGDASPNTKFPLQCIFSYCLPSNRKKDKISNTPTVFLLICDNFEAFYVKSIWFQHVLHDGWIIHPRPQNIMPMLVLGLCFSCNVLDYSVASTLKILAEVS